MKLRNSTFNDLQMTEASAFSPSHITGFFEILDQSKEIPHRGSVGAGVSLSKGVRTDVKVRKSNASRINVRINGELTQNAKVSEYVGHQYLEVADGGYLIEVNHEFDVPIGNGLGTSGAGALSLSLALNEALDQDLTAVEASQIAHRAEVESRTGLGTVISETYGGVEVRLKPGAPGIGRLVKIPITDDLQVFVASYGPISTSHILSTPWMRDRINGHAHQLAWSLLEQPNTATLLKLSRRFADGVGLESKRVKRLLSILDGLDFPSSMLMMGEGVFTVVNHEDSVTLRETLRQELPALPLLFQSKISHKGAHLLDS